MGVLRAVGISSMVILAGFLFLNGLGTQYGIISQIDEFTDEYPTNNVDQCDWADTGSFYNVNVTSNCELQLEDTSTVVENQELIRYLVTTESGWSTQYQKRINFDSGSDSYGDYITPASNPETVTVENQVSILKSKNPDTTQFETLVETYFTVENASKSMLLLTIGADDPSAQVESATYAGQSLTPVAREDDGAESTTFVYRLLDPPTGNNTLNFTFNKKHENNFGAIQLRNVDQSQPFRNLKTSSSASGGVDTALSTNEGNLLIDAVTSELSLTSGSNQNLLFNVPVDGDRDHASSWAQPEESQVMSWDTSGYMSQVVMDVRNSVETSNASIFRSNTFYSTNETVLELTGLYQESTVPDSATLSVYDTISGEPVVSYNMSRFARETEVVEAYQLPRESIYQIRVDIRNGTADAQRLYSLEATQSSEDITGLGIGEYESEVLSKTGEIKINELEFMASEIKRHGLSAGDRPRTIQIEFEGYRGSGKVAEKAYSIDDGLSVERGEVFPDTTIDSYSFDVYFISENGESSLYEKLKVSGTKFYRSVSEEVAVWFKTALFLIFVAMAFAYLAYAISTGRR